MSSPNVRLHLANESRKVTPIPGAGHAIVEGACPLCGASPFTIKGQDMRIHSHDTYAANAESLCCNKNVGEIRATVSTIFGLREDYEVLHGRARVY